MGSLDSGVWFGVSILGVVVLALVVLFVIEAIFERRE